MVVMTHLSDLKIKATQASQSLSVNTARAVTILRTNATLNNFQLWYGRATGLEEVRMFQDRVVQCQEKFIQLQNARREAYDKVLEVNEKLKKVHNALDQTKRGEENYLKLVMEEHEALNEEQRVLQKFHLTEQEERDAFSAFSYALKDSHSKEKMQQEHMKYWSLGGSVLGACIGIIGTSLASQYRKKEQGVYVNRLDDYNSQVNSVVQTLQDKINVCQHTLDALSTQQQYELIPMVSKLSEHMNNPVTVKEHLRNSHLRDNHNDVVVQHDPDAVALACAFSFIFGMIVTIVSKSF